MPRETLRSSADSETFEREMRTLQQEAGETNLREKLENAGTEPFVATDISTQCKHSFGKASAAGSSERA